jgi:hypothetical protein
MKLLYTIGLVIMAAIIIIAMKGFDLGRRL